MGSSIRFTFYAGFVKFFYSTERPNMIFLHTHDWIAGVSPDTSKPKTATTRIKKIGDYLRDGRVYDRHGRLRYAVGQVRGVQPNRGRIATGKIKILNITEIAPSEFTSEQIEAEGFLMLEQFMDVWTEMHEYDSFFAPQWHLEFEVYS
jgi:hypothetical protein